MKKSAYVILVFSLIIFGFSLCKPKLDDSKKTGFAITAADTLPKRFDAVIRDIPLNANGKLRMFYKNKNIAEKRLEFATLEDGIDSLEIRIWYGYTKTDTDQVVIIRNVNKLWRAEMYNLIYHYTPKYDSIISVDKQLSTGMPKSGWNSFMRQLELFAIKTLPDSHSIKGYPSIADADGITVEIASVNYYRIYYYNSPGIFKNEIPEAKRICDIMQLIRDELGFKQLRYD